RGGGGRDREAPSREDDAVRPAKSGDRVPRRRAERRGRPARRQRRCTLMVTGSLARRYARAILEIGTAHKNLDKIGGDLRSLAKAMHDSPELMTALINPAIRRADRRRVIDQLLDRLAAAQHTRNLVSLLLDGERLS